MHLHQRGFFSGERGEEQELNFSWVIDGNDCTSKLNGGQVNVALHPLCFRDAVRTQVDVKNEKKDSKQKIITLAYALRMHVKIKHGVEGNICTYCNLKNQNL